MSHCWKWGERNWWRYIYFHQFFSISELIQSDREYISFSIPMSGNIYLFLSLSLFADWSSIYLFLYLSWSTTCIFFYPSLISPQCKFQSLSITLSIYSYQEMKSVVLKSIMSILHRGRLLLYYLSSGLFFFCCEER